jgi:CRISPR-associated protein Cas1
MYYIFSNGRLKRKDNTVYIENEEGQRRAIPVEDITAIHIFGEIELNTKLLNFLSQKGITVHVYNYYGFYTGSFMPRDRNVSGELTVRQVEYYLDNEKRFYLAVSFVEGGIFHMLRNLRNYKKTEEFQKLIQHELNRAFEIDNISELMGCEGRARESYYQAFNFIFGGRFNMKKREKQPPTNPVNALISFGNSVMYSTILTEIYHTQLNPTVSYLHEPSQRRYSLSLDIAEIFKPLIVDPVIFRLVNNRI